MKNSEKTMVESIASENNNFKKHQEKLVPLIKCLTECVIGEEITVVKVNVGQRQKRRLANLGIVPGVKIKKKKSAPFRGPLQILVRGSSLVIGRGIASKIFVYRTDKCPD